MKRGVFPLCGLYFLGAMGAYGLGSGWGSGWLICALGGLAGLLALELFAPAQSLAHQSLRDSLTGLHSRRAAEDLINKALRRSARDQIHAFLIFDLDDFKQVNDTYGHLFGDLVLTEFTGLLERQARNVDILGRAGGDEFIVLMRDCADLDALREKLTRLLVKFSRGRYGGQQDLNLSVSVGAALFPQHGATYAQLFEKADQALYYAKGHGKNTFHIFS